MLVRVWGVVTARLTDEGVFRDIPTVKIEAKRRFVLLDGAAEIRSEEVLPVRRQRGREQGTACVQVLVVVLKKSLTSNLVTAGPGEDFNTPEARTVILGGERVGIEADLANGRLRGELAAGEAVNEDLAAAGPRAGTRHGL